MIMKSATWRRLFAVAFSIIPAALFAAPPSPGFRGPEPVSPGQSGQFRVVADRCPTFSWSAVPGAWGYEVVLYSARAGAEEATLLAETEPVLRAEIPAPASSWTPSLDQCLDPGERYVWFIREKGGFGQGDGAWSRGFAFEIDAEAALGLEALLEPLNQLQAQLEQIRQLGVVAPHDLADDLKSSVSHIRSVVDENLSLTGPVHSRVVQIHPNVLDIKSKTNDVKAATDQLLDIITENRGHITAEVRDLIDQAIVQVKFFATNELEGMDAFLGAEEVQFRSDILALIADLREVTKGVLDLGSPAGGVAPKLDTALLESLIERVPGEALYPLYRLFVKETNVLESVELSGVADDLQFIRPLFTGEGSSASGSAIEPLGSPGSVGGTAHQSSCDFVNGNFDRLTNIATQLAGRGVMFRAFGTYHMMRGETNLEHDFMIHGYFGGAIKNNPQKQFGTIFDGLGQVLLQISQVIRVNQRHCKLIGGQDAILAAIPPKQDIVDLKNDLDALDIATLNTVGSNLQTIETTLNGVDADVDGLATTLGAVDADVDALGATLLTHDGALSSHHAHLAALGNAIGAADAAHDLRLAAHDQGIVTSVAALDAKLDAVGQDLDLLRSEVDAIQIDAKSLQSQGMERQLVRCEPLVSLYLPSSHGGRLEAVMDLVSESISRAASAGVPTKDAEKHFARGQSEFASERYPKAFDEVCKAYRALTSGGGA